MGVESKRKVKYLVVDTTAFINNVALQELGENVLTVPQVVDEIKSKRQLRRLVVLPYDLKIKEAHQENIKFVSDFSKQTGDYKSLSATDINVIALTYQLEKEQKGVDHLNTAPIHKPKIENTSTIPEDLKNISGFYLPKKTRKKKDFAKHDSQDSDESSEYCSAEEGDFENQNELEDTEDENLENNDEKFFEEENNCDTPSSNITIEVNGEENQDKEVDTDDGNDDENEGDDEDEEDEDEDTWITPHNIDKIKKQTLNALNEDLENVTVACVTTDFAMQNVLKQIGLQVLSLDGRLIKQLRTFILRCYGCFKTTSVMTKVFCPNCGNKTLKKVAVSINEDGSQRLHINFRRPLTARGKKFSVPHFKGGKHSNNPIICEDQPLPQQRPSRLSRTKNDPLNDDYIAGFSPFVTRDINSKSAMLGIRPYVEMKHWMRKNPNEPRRRKK